jgi:dTDP-4-amino-4,6-dideoxygalactose transaminase
MELLLLFIVAIVFARIGWGLRELHAMRQVEQLDGMIKENLQQELEEIKKKYLPIKIEKVEHGYFVYSIPDNTFMAQGATRQELEQNLDKRYPGKRFAATPDNLKEIGFDV